MTVELVNACVVARLVNENSISSSYPLRIQREGAYLLPRGTCHPARSASTESDLWRADYERRETKPTESLFSMMNEVVVFDGTGSSGSGFGYDEMSASRYTSTSMSVCK